MGYFDSGFVDELRHTSVEHLHEVRTGHQFWLFVALVLSCFFALGLLGCLLQGWHVEGLWLLGLLALSVPRVYHARTKIWIIDLVLGERTGE